MVSQLKKSLLCNFSPWLVRFAITPRSVLRLNSLPFFQQCINHADYLVSLRHNRNVHVAALLVHLTALPLTRAALINMLNHLARTGIIKVRE